MFTQTTSGIAVSANPRFLPEQSEDGRFVWAYTIEIANNSADTVQLLSRHWRITDANGLTQEVRGPGVVGEQPVIQPGDSYSYTSACPLSTSSGMMVGSYQMVRLDDQAPLDVAVPAFALDSPHATRLAN
ncbi:apaG protein [alpha proteobacterium U9-1i]|nr:apaG protein [alpha proteobacterium U9-1i]